MRKRAHIDKNGKLNWGWIEMVLAILMVGALLYNGVGGYAVMASDVEQNTTEIKVNGNKIEQVEEDVDQVEIKIAGMEPVIQSIGRIEGKLDAVLLKYAGDHNGTQ